MKKKSIRKLSLHRETLRHLSRNEIRAVAGGTQFTVDWPDSCDSCHCIVPTNTAGAC